jgi:hypothetical protein
MNAMLDVGFTQVHTLKRDCINRVESRYARTGAGLSRSNMSGKTVPIDIPNITLILFKGRVDLFLDCMKCMKCKKE